LLARTGAGSWAGPGVCEGFGVPSDQEPDEIMQACFCDLLSGQGEGAGWRQWPQPRPSATAQSPSTPVPSATDKRAKSPISMPVPAEWTTPNSVLWGGNLAVLVSLLGTPYFPDIQRGLLFLEDVGEHPYRIERMLTQLLHAGVLARQRAIILGQFTDYKLTPHDRGYTLHSAVAWLRSQLKVPVITNLPFGHGPTKVMLPIGRMSRLILSGRDALLYWG
ncbi:MAG: LD-carboxypeptidase, partial [Rhodoferax sp.]|nr:LD-carboxypeptidase [Rhodoferax sp.]